MAKQILLYYNHSEEQIKKFQEKLEAEDFKTISLNYNRVTENHELFVDEKEFKAGRVYLAQFLGLTEKELENQMKEDNQVDFNEHDQNAYVNKQDKYEDVHSSGTSLLFVSITGTILLILEGIGVLPQLQWASDFSKYLFFTVMGLMFIIFFVIGIKSLKQAKTLSYESAEEQLKEDAILEYISKEIKAEQVDAAVLGNETDSNEYYFLRTEYLSKILQENFPESDVALINHLVEKVYDDLFEK